MTQDLINHLENLLLEVSKYSEDESVMASLSSKSAWEETTFTSLEESVYNIVNDRMVRSEIYRIDFRPALGHLFSLLLDLFAESKIDVNIRLRAANLLCLLTRPEFEHESADLIAFILPGIFSKCRAILSSTELHSLDVIRHACRLIVNVVEVSFSNIESVRNHQPSSKESNPVKELNSILEFRRGIQWIEMAKGKLIPQISLLLSGLCQNSTDIIRFEAINMLSQIRKWLKYNNELNRTTIDLATFLFKDPYQRTTNLAKQLLDEVKEEDKQFFESHLLTKLTKTTKSLEKNVKNASDGKIYIENLIILVQIADVSLLKRLFDLPDFINRFLSSITHIIDFDYNRQLISESYEDSNQNVTMSLSPLKHGLDVQQFKALTEAMVVAPNSDVLLEWLYDKFQSNSTQLNRKVSIAYLIYALLSAFQQCPHRSSQQFVEDVLEMLSPLESLLEKEVTDSQIDNMPVINSQESCLSQVLLACLSTFCSQNDINSTRIRVDVTYELLKWCSSSNFGIKNSAECALDRLAKSHSSPNVSSFILHNAQHIVFKLAMHSRDFSVHPRFPAVFAEMVSKSKEPTILPQIRSIVDELLLWLDRGDQRRTVILLRAIGAYLHALLEWYPDLAPPSTSKIPSRDDEEGEKVDDEEQGKHTMDPNYSLVKDAVSILNRTKHFVFSPHLPVLIIILDILDCSLHLVRNYENELLPMVHQNWQGLIRKFDIANFGQLLDSQKIVMAKSLKVVSSFCKLSGDFVYWKIVQEFIPRVVRLFENLLEESQELGRIYTQTAAFKLQYTLLDSIPTILKSATIAPKHYKPLEELLKIYLKKEKLTSELRDKAEQALNKLQYYDV